ncbi:DUF1906 domain-containing protein [Streptomyces sp. WAC01280]|uniref:DUF1906 domain-containing protein n=1 Tax=Streptomyces sp. WAC01280 TaxID=2487424 RepID=UPI0021AF9D6E|nr:DUF1906 domain-containing protein [Streptomyces sp. WAC01280]
MVTALVVAMAGAALLTGGPSRATARATAVAAAGAPAPAAAPDPAAPVVAGPVVAAPAVAESVAAAPAIAGPVAAESALAGSVLAQPAVAESVPAQPAVAHPVAAAPGLAGPAVAEPAPRFEGKAFDTCEAPSLAVMKAWLNSPYRAVGIYFGGRGRGCPTQKELSPTWVASAHAMGWRLLPLFVGSQAPCVYAAAKRPYAIGSTPWSQGIREAGDAVRAARALGIGTSSPLYLDIESYQVEDASCAATTLSFVRSWNREVRRLGYLPGYYSSADTGIRHIEGQRKAGTLDLPSVMWFARWRGTPALYTETSLHPEAWTPHARIHQYVGNVAESYGGRRMVIDRNAVDAPVARITTTGS